MKVGDKAVLLPARKRRRFVHVAGLKPITGGAFAEIVTARANGRRRWVSLLNLQLPDALPTK